MRPRTLGRARHLLHRLSAHVHGVDRVAERSAAAASSPIERRTRIVPSSPSSMSRGMRQLLHPAPALALFAIVLLVSCVPRTGSPGRERRTISEAEELVIGKAADQLVRKDPGLYTARADLTAYVRSVGSKIAARSKRHPEGLTFAIVDTSDLNAFALPGGFVYVTRGLLGWLNSEDELAAVLAHEVAHVSERHGLARLARPPRTAPPGTNGSPRPRTSSTFPDASTPETSASSARAMGQDSLRPIEDSHQPAESAPAGGSPSAGPAESGPDVRGAEALLVALERSAGDDRAASALARTYVTGAGYDPQGIERLAATLTRARRLAPRRSRSWAASHPSASELRQGDRGGRLPDQGAGTSRASTEAADPGREAYLKAIEGMAAGQSNPVSWVSGNLYVNSKHDFSLRIPKGWAAELRGADLGLAGPDVRGRATMKVQTLVRPGVSGDAARDHARSAAREGEIIGPITRAGVPAGEAAIVTMRSQDGSGQPLHVRKMFLVRFDRAYVLTFTVPASQAEDTERTFMHLTGSIAFLTPDQIQSLPAPRIGLHRVQEQETWASIAKRTAGTAAGDPSSAEGGRGLAGDDAAQAPGEAAQAPDDAAQAPGETQASLAEKIAAFNGRDPGEPPEPGLLVKIPPPAEIE